MRTLQRNRQPIWYALYQDVTDAVDRERHKTGEKITVYSTPVKTFMNVSAGRGHADVEIFGIENPFTRTAVTEDMETDFQTSTIFWFGKEPSETVTDYNYICTGVATTINGRVIALKEVEVSDAEDIA